MQWSTNDSKNNEPIVKVLIIKPTIDKTSGENDIPNKVTFPKFPIILWKPTIKATIAKRSNPD